MTLGESQPYLTLTILKALGLATLKGNQSGTSRRVLAEYALRKKQHKTEIMWTLKSMMSHFLYSLSGEICHIFGLCFQTVPLLKKMKCGPTKVSYIIPFGLAPYFKKLLLAELEEAPCFVVSVDESLNKELQQEQMDFIVKFFKADEVEYRNLAFMDKHEQKISKKKIEEGTQDLEMKTTNYKIQ